MIPTTDVLLKKTVRAFYFVELGSQTKLAAYNKHSLQIFFSFLFFLYDVQPYALLDTVCLC